MTSARLLPARAWSVGACLALAALLPAVLPLATAQQVVVARPQAPDAAPEFVQTLCRRWAELGGRRFDKIMTNGVWYLDEAHPTEVLTGLKEAGFTGKLGLSVDKFHGIATDRLAAFCHVARRVFDRDTILSLSYASRNPHAGLEPIQRLAGALDGVLEWSDLLRRYLLVTPELTMTLNWNHLAPVERAEKLAGGWDGTWFVEDYCEGPGQALIVNPKGEVKPCCGFASDLDQLTIGNVHTDTVADIILQARRHPYVGQVFREGLTAIKDEILARDPNALPGASSNQCFVCWYVLTRGLVDGVSGGGGQVGGWTGERANFQGELLQVGSKFSATSQKCRN